VGFEDLKTLTRQDQTLQEMEGADFQRGLGAKGNPNST